MTSAIEDRWQRGKLGDLLPLKYGKGLPEKSRDSSGAVPVFGSSGQVGRHTDPLTRGPTLIVGRKGTVGAVHLSPEPCWPIDTVYFAEAEEGQNLKYYKYLLDSLNLARLDRSTAVPGLSRDDYNAVEVTIAPSSEQERIVADLEKQFSRLDEAVANLKRVKANLKRYTAAVLGAAVGGGLVPTEAALAQAQGRAYESGESLLRRIFEASKGQREGKGKFSMPEGLSASELPSLPDGWVWTTAMQACDVVVDCHNKTAPYVPAGIPLVRTTNIRDGRLLFEDMRYVDQPTYDFWSRRCPPKPGDVLFTREAPMGEAAVIPPGLRICLGQRTMLMRPSAALDKGFLLAALMSPVVRRLIDRVAVGSGVKHLRVGDVERIAVPLPPLAEQQRIVAELERRLSIVREVEAEVDANLQRASSVRSSVLSGAFAVDGLDSISKA